MKAIDLMIGNYVNFSIDGKSYHQGIIETIIHNKIGLKYGTYVKLKNVDPIPLTEQWLIDFGFKLRPWGWVKNEMLLRTNKVQFWIELGNGKRIEFLHVHTLQNFWSLTGKQLTK